MGLVAAASALAAEAVRAIDGLAAGRAERDLGFAAAACARCAEHLARTAVIATARGLAPSVAAGARDPTRRLADRATGRATTWFAELPIGVELLLTGGKREFLAAVGAGERLVTCGREHEKLLLTRPQRTCLAENH